MHRDELRQRLDELLEIEGMPDWGPNGLQVEGQPEISSVATAVTACRDAIDETARRGAQVLVVHHGIFWDPLSPVLKGHHLGRVRALLDSGITLLAYHLPLDRHPEVGNNAPVLRELGGVDLEPFAVAKGVSIGWSCRFAEPMNSVRLYERLREIYGLQEGDPVHAFMEGPREIRRLGLVSGGGQGELQTAIDQGLDAYVTGEVSEYNRHLAREEGIHHFSLGHHATERIGPRCLADWIARETGLPTSFIDIPNSA